jgi:hypothetical protein
MHRIESGSLELTGLELEKKNIQVTPLHDNLTTNALFQAEVQKAYYTAIMKMTFEENILENLILANNGGDPFTDEERTLLNEIKESKEKLLNKRNKGELTMSPVILKA